MHTSYIGSRTRRSSLHPRFFTTVNGLRSVTVNFPIWFVMAVDRGELNDIFCLTCIMCLSKFVALLRDGKVGSCHCQIDAYYGWCLFKCWIIIVVFPDLYYDPTNHADSKFFFFNFSTPMCFCHRMTETFTNK